MRSQISQTPGNRLGRPVSLCPLVKPASPALPVAQRNSDEDCGPRRHHPFAMCLEEASDFPSMLSYCGFRSRATLPRGHSSTRLCHRLSGSCPLLSNVPGRERTGNAQRGASSAIPRGQLVANKRWPRTSTSGWPRITGAACSPGGCLLRGQSVDRAIGMAVSRRPRHRLRNLEE